MILSGHVTLPMLMLCCFKVECQGTISIFKLLHYENNENVNTVNMIKTTILLKALYDTKYLFILKVVMCIYGQQDNWLVKIIFIPVNKKVYITVTSPYRTPQICKSGFGLKLI